MAVAITTLAMVLSSIPSSFDHYRGVCDVVSGVCSGRTVVQPSPEGVRALHDAGLSARSYALLNVVVDKAFQLVWLAVGTLIFWRRSDDAMALLVSAFLVTFGPVTVDTTHADALVAFQPAWWLPARGVQVLGEISVVLFFLLFPHGRFASRWTLWLAVLFIAFMFSMDFFAGWYSRSPALEMVSLGVFAVGVLSLVSVQTYSYHRFFSPEQRRQTKWVVFGATLAIAASFPFKLPVDLYLVGGDAPVGLLLLKTGFALSFLLIPISIGVAVLRSGLFDIDVLINRTLVYGLLTAMLVAVYVGGVVGLQHLFRALAGGESEIAIVASTLAIAALFQPLRRRLQSFIDRRFYRRKYDARRTLDRFSETLRHETDLGGLKDDLEGVVGETVQPAHVSVWLRSNVTANPRQGTLG